MARAASVTGLLITLSLIIVVVFSCGCTNSDVEEKPRTIGILSGLEFFANTTNGLKSGMADLGYVEGNDIIYDVVKADSPVGNEDVIQGFVDKKVDIILSFPTEASMEAKAVASGTGIPVVFTNANIEDTNLVDSIAEPGGNITGVRYPGPDIALRRFDIMVEMLPDVKRIWIPYQEGYPIVTSQLDALGPVADEMGINITGFGASNTADLKKELDRLRGLDDVGFDAMLFIAEPLAVTPDAFELLGEFAYEKGIPMGGVVVQAGNHSSIFGVHVDSYMVGEQAATLVNKILEGTPAGKIPVLSAESRLIVDYLAAKEFGMDLDENILSKADSIIR